MVDSIKTYYKGTYFRSRFEANTAYFFDTFSLSWLYEPISFLLPSGTHYWPDFYIPALSLWVEVRGYVTEKGQAQIDEFSTMINLGNVEHYKRSTKKMNNPRGGPDYLVVKEQGDCDFYESEERLFVRQSNESIIAKCKECGSYFVYGICGAYQCRACGKWDGNNHIAEASHIVTENGKIYIE